MAFAQGSRTGLSYIVESSFGVTPTSPTLTELPYNTHSLDLNKQRVQGNEITRDRQPRYDRHGNKNAVGDIVVQLADTSYDDLIESAFFSSLDSSGVMKVGTTPKFMTIQDFAEDITQVRIFRGCGVSTMSMSIAPNQMVLTTFSMVGKDMEQTPTPLDASPTLAAGGEPFDAYSGVLLEGGSQVAIITGIDWSISNSLAPTFTVGSDSTTQLEYGRAVVEGTISAYYEDATLINKFINETESSLSVTTDDPTSGLAYTWFFPRVKYNGAAAPVQNPQSRVINLPFVALYDSVEGTNLKLTKA